MESLHDRFHIHLINELRNMVGSGLIAENDPEELSFTLIFISMGYREIRAIKHRTPGFEIFHEHTLKKDQITGTPV